MPEVKENKWITKANVKLVSDGTIQGTKIVLEHEEQGEIELFPVTKAVWTLDASPGGDATPHMEITMALVPGQFELPAELLSIVRESTPYEVFASENAKERLKEQMEFTKDSDGGS